MAWSFNPFTGNLDLVGGGGTVVFEGEVETFADLPETVGNPPVGSSYLVRTSTGVWLVNRRQAGIWIRRNNTGVRATDWEYGGDYPVNSVNGQTGNVVLSASDVGAPPTSRTISAGAGLTGGGDLTANRTLAVAYGTTSGTACQGNDARLSDSRNPLSHAASHAAGTKAEFNDQVAGMTEDVFIRAVTAGTAGNSITLTFDGVETIIDVLAAWNSANPSNQASLISGNDQQIPDNGEEITLSGGVAGGSDPFKNINQDLGTQDEVAFAKITLTAPANGEVIRIDGVGGNGSDVGFAVYNTTGDQANSFFFNQASEYVGIGVGEGEGYIQASVPLLLPNIKNSLVIRDGDGGQTGMFDADGNLTANRTYDLPDASGTLALTSDIPSTFAASAITSGVLDNARINFAAPSAIGSTTASSGAFTTLSASTSLTLGTSGILSGGTNIIEQRNTTSAQTFRIYNTVSGAADANYERGFMRWSSNQLQIGSEAAGTGSARDIVIFRGTNDQVTIGDSAVTLRGSTQVLWNARFVMRSDGDGQLRLSNWAQNGFDRLMFGGTTSSFPALKRSSTTLQVRLADDSGYTVLDAQLRAQGTAPATSGATGTAGDIRYDADYIYICTAANTWKRAAIATW